MHAWLRSLRVHVLAVDTTTPPTRLYHGRQARAARQHADALGSEGVLDLADQAEGGPHVRRS